MGKIGSIYCDLVFLIKCCIIATSATVYPCQKHIQSFRSSKSMHDVDMKSFSLNLTEQRGQAEVLSKSQ